MKTKKSRNTNAHYLIPKGVREDIYIGEKWFHEYFWKNSFFANFISTLPPPWEPNLTLTLPPRKPTPPRYRRNVDLPPMLWLIAHVCVQPTPIESFAHTCTFFLDTYFSVQFIPTRRHQKVSHGASHFQLDSSWVSEARYHRCRVQGCDMFILCDRHYISMHIKSVHRLQLSKYYKLKEWIYFPHPTLPQHNIASNRIPESGKKWGQCHTVESFWPSHAHILANLHCKSSIPHSPLSE